MYNGVECHGWRRFALGTLNLSLDSPLHTYFTLPYLSLRGWSSRQSRPVFAPYKLKQSFSTYLPCPTLPYLTPATQLGRQSLEFSLTADAKYVRLLSRRLIHLVAVNSMSITPLLP